MNDLFEQPLADTKTGMVSHERISDGKDEWLTPPEIIQSLGEFDLDPCSPINRPWPTAKAHFTIEDNGLIKPWAGRVYCNPPYGNETSKWIGRLAEHGNGVALIFARTETETWFSHIWPKAHSVFFFQGRLYFRHVSGSTANYGAGAPSALISYGAANTEAVRNSGLKGKLVIL